MKFQFTGVAGVLCKASPQFPNCHPTCSSRESLSHLNTHFPPLNPKAERSLLDMTMIKEHHDEKPQTPFEGLPRPEKGPLNAAEVGYSYHLIVRGYDDADEPDLETFVRRFLRILFGDNNANCPVKYGFHSIIPDASNQSRKILRVSPASQPLSLTSLREHCKFDDQHTSCSVVPQSRRENYKLSYPRKCPESLRKAILQRRNRNL